VGSHSPTENLLPITTTSDLSIPSGSKVAKLAKMAANAIRNVNLHRALELIEEIRKIAERSGGGEGDHQSTSRDSETG
jgi:hypothetical protein